MTDYSKFSSVSYNQVVKPKATQQLEGGNQNSAIDKENMVASTPVALHPLLFISGLTILFNQVCRVVPVTVKRLVCRIGANGEVHEKPILTTYRRSHNQEHFEDLEEEYPGKLLLFLVQHILTHWLSISKSSTSHYPSDGCRQSK